MNLYENRLAKLIQIILRKGINDISEIALRLDGVHPIDILRIVKSADFTSEKFSNEHYLSSVIEPNPVDSEWRFTDDSVIKLSQLVTDKNSRIACFGVPSLYFYLKFAGYTNVILFDINPFLKELFPNDNNIITTDLGQSIKYSSIFEIVFMDPPWYQKSFILWIQHAVNSLVENGVIYLTKIPKLIRPTANKEWNTIKTEFNEIIEFSELNQTLFYETPLFELEACKASGLDLKKNWRHTKMVKGILKIKKNYTFDSPIIDPWHRYKFDKQVVSLKIDKNDIDNITVNAPYSDGSYILKSVSRRDKTRSSVNFITSRNKGLILTGTRVISKFLEKYSNTLNFEISLPKGINSNEIKNLQLILAVIGN